MTLISKNGFRRQTQRRSSYRRRRLRRSRYTVHYQRSVSNIWSCSLAHSNGQIADQTSYINYIKPLIFAEELGFPYLISVIDTTSQWFYKIHPERMVPSLKDRDPQSGEEVIVFEGTACLQYLADRFDTDGLWNGRNAYEKGAILSWTAYQTAALG